MYLAGQACGIIGTIITLIKPQLRRRMQMLLLTMLGNLMSILNFVLIGQKGSAVSLCAVAVVQCIFSMVHEKRNTQTPHWESLLFFALYLGCGIFGMVSAEGFVWELSWKNALECLPIFGALMLMLSVFAKEEQHIRWFLLCSASIWMVYTAIIWSTTFFSSTVSMLSSAIALWKYRQKKTETKETPA